MKIEMITVYEVLCSRFGTTYHLETYGCYDSYEEAEGEASYLAKLGYFTDVISRQVSTAFAYYHQNFYNNYGKGFKYIYGNHI